MYKKTIVAGCIITMLCLVLSTLSANAQDEPVRIRFSHVVAENTPKGIGAKLFKELVEERLSEKVKVEIYPSSQKYTDGQAILALLFGDLEMAAPSFPKFRQYTKALQVFDLPFLFNNVEEVHKFQQSDAGQGLLNSMEELGITGLAYWDNGMRVLSADEKIRLPKDLKGLSFRIESSLIFQEHYRNLGALAIPMPFKELPNALREGVVDGYENAWSNINSKKLYKMRNYFSEINASYLGYVVVASKSFWDGLPDDIRAELEQIITDVTLQVNQLAKERELSDISAVLKQPNVELVQLSDEERQAWRDAGVPIWEQFQDEIGSDLLQAAQSR